MLWSRSFGTVLVTVAERDPEMGTEIDVWRLDNSNSLSVSE